MNRDDYPTQLRMTSSFKPRIQFPGFQQRPLIDAWCGDCGPGPLGGLRMATENSRSYILRTIMKARTFQGNIYSLSDVRIWYNCIALVSGSHTFQWSSQDTNQHVKQDPNLVLWPASFHLVRAPICSSAHKGSGVRGAPGSSCTILGVLRWM